MAAITWLHLSDLHFRAEAGHAWDEDVVLRALLEDVRARVREGVTRVFSRTILFLLQGGPLRTIDLHPQIKRIHPDLCDDSVDRVIDGERFGKRWKHLVRTAQQILKRDGSVQFDGTFWRLVGHNK